MSRHELVAVRLLSGCGCAAATGGAVLAYTESWQWTALCEAVSVIAWTAVCMTLQAAMRRWRA
jgi:hypothetical protein